jgi:type IV secretory pathway VirB10-like protein
VNIPDVLTRDQGLPCSIFVMRDLVIDAYKLKVR